MKKKILAVLGLLCSMTLMAGFAACDSLLTPPSNSGDNSSSSQQEVTYSLDSTKFEKVVAYKSTLNYNNLAIKSSLGETINVTADMVSGAVTDKTGNQTLTISYEGETFNVGYEVKYEVKFVVDGKTVDRQLVLRASEVKYPTETPVKEGDVFEGWQPAKIQAVTDNITVQAKFKGTEIGGGDENVTADIEFENADVYVREYGEAGDITFTTNSTAQGLKYELELSNQNIDCEMYNGLIAVKANKAGVTELTLKVTDAEGNVLDTATKKVVVKPHSFLINKAALGSGDIEGIRTIGRTDVKGNTTQFPLNIAYGAEASIGEGLMENIVWTSNNANATITDGKITLKETSGEAEMVTFGAKFVVDGVTYDVSNETTLRCVWDGVNVNSYEDLWTATRANQKVVLNTDIKDDFSATNYTTMYTTYDDTYYKNYNANPLQNDAKELSAEIKILLEFKNDLYGNGYQINAHNATYKLDSAGKLQEDAIFNGPLNFVAMGSPNAGTISVKAQDNVCFALFEGVTVNNVELRGCDLQADDKGNYDLTDLDYIGTTVEVFGDNVNIEYSRLTNGRTVLRVFGDKEDATKPIHVNVSNSVLQGAREFILRTGSNCFKSPESSDLISPYLGSDNATKQAYNTKKNYANMSANEKKAYDEEYIKTFVNIKNSVFKDAGIFAIGMESHFAGLALHDPESQSLINSVLGTSAKYWKNLAKTSYGAKVSFEGIVRMYNWKPLDQIDSSTLITNMLPDGDTWATLTFNVKQMVENVCTGENAKFPTIVTEVEGKNWVHAGIAFWGGGKNYSVFEGSATSEQLVGFEVTLADVGQAMLEVAAGNEAFYFMLCDETSSFTPQEQDKILEGGHAYDCLYVK